MGNNCCSQERFPELNEQNGQTNNSTDNNIRSKQIRHHSQMAQESIEQMREVQLDRKLPQYIQQALLKFPNEPVTPIFNGEFEARSSHLLFDLGFTPENTLFATSFCPDELNNLEGGLCDFMTKSWGELFPMGGLAGIPFTGKGGFGAFSGHVPENGNLFLLFASHIGIDRDGTIGKYTRHGQQQGSTSCGAALGVLNMLKNGQKIENPEIDLQMQWIYDQLKPHLQTILKSENQELEVTKLIYQMTEDQILKIINTNFGTGKIAVCGGILINYIEEDLFVPRYFKVHQQGYDSKDLLQKLSKHNDMQRLLQKEDEQSNVSEKQLETKDTIHSNNNNNSEKSQQK